MEASSIGDLLGPILTVAFVCWIFWAFRELRRKPKMARDRPDQVYSAYTKQFDQELSAGQLQSALAEANVRADMASGTTLRDPNARRASALEAYERAKGLPAVKELHEAFGSIGNNCSLCLLVDQSGSMANRMVAVAGQLKLVSEIAANAGIELAIFGFTTVGWQGGQARKLWSEAGSPAYPGRLCALMHIVYQDFGQPLGQANWEAMCEPNIFFENVDGEAIQWAAGRLTKRTSDTKLLIVASDGAPVDDATLLANGPEILVRHLKKVIGETECKQELRFGAIGIGYNVGSYYSTSEKAEGPEDFVPRLGALIARLSERDD